MNNNLGFYFLLLCYLNENKTNYNETTLSLVLELHEKHIAVTVVFLIQFSVVFFQIKFWSLILILICC